MRLLTLFSGLLAVSTATAAATPARAAGAAVPVVERQVPDFHRGLDAQDVCRFFFHMSSVSADMYHPAHEISGTNGAQLLDKGIPGEKKGPYGYIINQLVYMMGRMDGFRASLRTTDPFEIPLEEQKIDYCVRGVSDWLVSSGIGLVMVRADRRAV